MTVNELRDKYVAAIAEVDKVEGEVQRIGRELWDAEHELRQAKKNEEEALLEYAQALGIPLHRISTFHSPRLPSQQQPTGVTA